MRVEQLALRIWPSKFCLLVLQAEICVKNTIYIKNIGFLSIGWSLLIYSLDENGKYHASRLLTDGDIAVSEIIKGLKVDLTEIFDRTS